jgi:transposase
VPCVGVGPDAWQLMAEPCVSPIPGVSQLPADKGYDSNTFRKFLKDHGTRLVIHGKSNRKKKIRHDKEAYKKRNVVERCFCRLKDSRRIATRYDKLARKFFRRCASLPLLRTGYSGL